MIDAKNFMDALKELEEQKGVSKEEIISALKEALRKAYTKSLQGGDDAIVNVIISEDPATISIQRIKKIVDEVEDDYIEISKEDAKKEVKNKKFSYNEDKTELIEEVGVEELSRYFALTVKSVLRQKLIEAERSALFSNFKEKMGEMVSGIVERCDDNGASVNIGRNHIYISRKELIGDEMFASGDPIRLYVTSSKNGEKDQQVRLTRSDAGFLKKLFEESVRDIYDGTVIIKNIAREAGIRSKVSVYSNDLNVDPCSACIGPQGQTILNIIANLGNSRDKEKVDVIKYSPNNALYIIDALKPANVEYIYVDEELKEATVVVPDGTQSVAIGKKGANTKVARTLTGYNINVIEMRNKSSHEEDFDIKFLSNEQVREEENLREQKEKYERYLAQLKANRARELVESELTSGVEKGKPQQILDEDLREDEKVEEVVETKEVIQNPVETKEIKRDEPKEVKTTTTLDALEASLEVAKKKETFKATQKTSKRPKTITEKEVAHEEVKEEERRVVPQMDIFTKEELEEFENEDLYEDEYEDEEIDYDEFEEYYDDDDK